MTLFASPHIAGLTVLAIDPGASLGYALMQRNGVCEHGVHRWPSTPKGMKWRALVGLLSRIQRDAYGPIDAIYFEYSTWKRHPLAMLDHGGFVALLEYWAEMAGFAAPIGVAPSVIRKHVTGSGRTAKLPKGMEETDGQRRDRVKGPVIAAVNRMGFEVTNDDQADAIALLDYALAHLALARRVA